MLLYILFREDINVNFFHNNLSRSDQLFAHIKINSFTNYATMAYVLKEKKHHAFQTSELDGSKVTLT
jgi:hypothetical protein